MTYVITVTPTIMDGQVARWYMNLDEAHGGHPLISASRRGVQGHGFITPRLFEEAWAIHIELQAHPLGSDVRRIATHYSPNLFGRQLIPVPEDDIHRLKAKEATA